MIQPFHITVSCLPLITHNGISGHVSGERCISSTGNRVTFILIIHTIGIVSPLVGQGVARAQGIGEHIVIFALPCTIWKNISKPNMHPIGAKARSICSRPFTLAPNNVRFRSMLIFSENTYLSELMFTVRLLTYPIGKITQYFLVGFLITPFRIIVQRHSNIENSVRRIRSHH